MRPGRLFAGIAIFLITTVSLGADPPASPLAYFSRVRDVNGISSDKQSYVVLDEAVLQHSRADLGDLRFYAGSTEVPYAIALKRGSSEGALSTIPILNKGTVRGNTQFVVDVGIPEYDNIHIETSAKDFITQAKLEGASSHDAKDWTDLGRFTIFDFTKEKLGQNLTARLHSPSRFRFVRVTIMGALTPEDVRGASVANVQESKAKYETLSQKPTVRQDGKKTVIEWSADENVPLDRVHFTVDAAEVNYNRNATLECDARYVTGFGLSRIHMERKGRKIDSEDTDIELAGLHCKHYKISIENGDDAPLRIAAVAPQMLERRVYFKPSGQSALKLFYGDEKLERPSYDFAKLFEEPESAEAVQASLGPETQNAAHTGRPDERPWSEKHPAVLWAAMIVAVGALGAWALKGFKA